MPFFVTDRLALTRLLIPMDLRRFYEMPKVGTAVVNAQPKHVLDLSSPKLLAVWLARQGYRVTATDVWPREIRAWQTLLGRTMRTGLLRDNLFLSVADGQALAFPDNTFDVAYSLSVIEHIPDIGDRRALQELKRVTKVGGEIILTVPYGQTYSEHFAKAMYTDRPSGEKVFSHRIYDDRALEERLIAPSGLVVMEKEICTDTVPFFYDGLHARCLPFSVLWGNLNPLLAALALRAGTAPKGNQWADVFLRLRKTT